MSWCYFSSIDNISTSRTYACFKWDKTGCPEDRSNETSFLCQHERSQHLIFRKPHQPSYPMTQKVVALERGLRWLYNQNTQRLMFTDEQKKRYRIDLDLSYYAIVKMKVLNCLQTSNAKYIQAWIIYKMWISDKRTMVYGTIVNHVVHVYKMKCQQTVNTVFISMSCEGGSSWI